MSNNKEIKSEKIFVRQVLEMWFTIPVYQRPYVWGNEEISDFLDDISYAALHNPTNEYFIGSIVLQDKPKDDNHKRNINFKEYYLMDGQQRITTLLLLIAVIRDLTQETKLKQTCQEFICQQENAYKGIPERMRIISDRHEVQLFIDSYVKPEGGTLKYDDLKYTINYGKDITAANMACAVMQINEYFSDEDNIDKEKFFGFLMNYVLMIYVSTEDFADAFMLFTVLNARGIPLRNCDILKAINLGEIRDKNDQEIYSKLWTDIENEHGDEFDRFLSFIRTLYVKEKPRLSLLKEFEEKIYIPQGKDKKALLKKGADTFKRLKQINDHYSTLFSQNNYAVDNSWRFDNLLLIMNEGYLAKDWIPPLLAYFDKYKNTMLVEFLLKLDNKVSGDWIAQETPTSRIEYMNKILKKIEESLTPTDIFNSDVFSFDRVAFCRNIEGKVYGRRWDKYVLLKLDFLIQSSKEKRGGYSKISIEHILPQSPDQDSQWCIDFDSQQREGMTHLLGNLVLISRQKNSSQSRYEYSMKKSKYFKNNIETFPNSVRVMARYDKWTPTELNENHKTVINMLKNHYE
ncbi:MAG: DUF262 domain-containing HNH endonuclease family protein [Nitrospirota bacterium]